MTISAEWFPGWAITGFPGPPGEVVSGCGAGEASCTVRMNSPTGGYVRYQLNFCCFNAREQDYYAVTPADEYTIEGEVKERVGPRLELKAAAFAEVTAVIDGDVYPGETNKFGQYAIQVEEGVGTVRTAGKQCVKDQLPKCVTVKQVTVGPNQKVDFEAPPPGKIKGVVKDEDHVPVEGVTIRADDPAGGRIDTATSDANGLYELTVRAGPVHLSADDPQTCAISGEKLCPKTKDIEVEANDTAIQDWKREGCVKKVDFGTSMVAVRGCFKKIADEEWETDEKFTMNGIAMFPTEKVTFDKQSRRVSFGGGEAKLDDQSILTLQSLNLDFPTSETKFTLPAIKSKIKGFELEETLELKMEAGKTTLSSTAKLDTKLGTPAEGEKGECKGAAAVVVSLTTTNDDLLRAASFEAKDLTKVFCLPGLSRFKAMPIDSVKGAYDFKTHWWAVGGSVVAVEPFKSRFPKLKDAKGGLEVFLNQNLKLQGVSLSAKGLNIPLEPPKIFIQNLGVKLGQTNQGEAFKSEISLGASLGPKLGKAVKESLPILGEIVVKPEEAAALDVAFGSSIAENTGHEASVEDLTLSAKGVLKVWDQQFIEGTAKLVIPSASFSLSGAIDYKVGNVLTLHGDGSGWVDSVNSLVFAEGFGQVSVFAWRAATGNILFNSSVANSGGPILVGCLRSPDNVEFGVSYNFKLELPKITGCDLSEYKAVKPAGARLASVSATRGSDGQLVRRQARDEGAGAGDRRLRARPERRWSRSAAPAAP